SLSRRAGVAGLRSCRPPRRCDRRRHRLGRGVACALRAVARRAPASGDATVGDAAGHRRSPRPHARAGTRVPHGAAWDHRRPAPAPLVLANLLAAAHRARAPCYARLVAGGGTLVAGGCLDTEAHDVTATLVACGFRHDAARSIDGWTTLAYEHAPLRNRA